MDDSRVREVIDFSQPVAVLLFAILHFVTDAERPSEIISRFTGLMAPGSFLALSHITDEEVEDEDSRAAQQVYQGASAPVVPRSHAQIIRFFDGLEVASPGLVDINHWPGASPASATLARLLFYGGGVARKKTRSVRELARS